MKKAFIILVLFFASTALAQIDEIPDELAQCKRLASKYSARTEVLMPDGSRCDLLSEKYAIEVDWAKDKWKESIGQAILYSIWTDREPAILLLVKDMEKERVDILRAKLVCERLRIKMFIENARDRPVIRPGA